MRPDTRERDIKTSVVFSLRSSVCISGSDLQTSLM